MQVEAQNQVVRRLEEKERLLQSSLAAAEKELMLRQQAMEMHKRKAIESAQSAADLKLHLGNDLKNLEQLYKNNFGIFLKKVFEAVFKLVFVFSFKFAEKYHSQMKEAQQVVAEKTSTLEAEAYKTKRLQVRKIFNFFPYFTSSFIKKKITKCPLEPPGTKNRLIETGGTCPAAAPSGAAQEDRGGRYGR